LEQRLGGNSLYFVAEGGGWSAAKEFARQGLGVAFVPEATVTAADLGQLVKRRLAADFSVTDLLVHSHDESRAVVLAAKKAIASAAKATMGR
jgi:DNA-binding transcriptional LysR family regulator